MRNFTIYLAVAACLLAGKITAQETFESKARQIAEKIERITKEEKEALKIEIEEVNKQFENGTITKKEADDKKKKLAEARALIIENKVAVSQEELKELVQQKVNGKILSSDKNDSSRVKIGRISINFKNDTIRYNKTYKEKRTTSQFVFAAGLNNVVTDGDIENSDFRFWGSHFYEWGLTYNTRIAKNSNLLHLKYGMSVMYNNLRPTDNRMFVVNGNQTNLEDSGLNLKESRFRNVYLVAPLHFEFDFSGKTIKDDKTYFRTHQAFRMGFGGYAGVRVKSKQILKYEIDDIEIKEKMKGDFNSSNFIYGLSAYIGYKETSLYVKYDLNPLFRNNAVKQNNISLGVRFDLN
ncbi:hypothetical protein [Flavobacterium capsici]|uniref:PorT family protein n=1 Tax=Flavobacterium capsici TaxID=3075618 RepID=A0AA96J3D1_9FLAO|nr:MULTISPECIES: hypothetical protein [unclassified Flavobacterium]WNM19198.1 hypothetical protein RN608_00605 [Flavobacterium sp. PMR2A8]WNM20587.1 hypothetical protein RN605_07775 [Flavobacterium sp. PMTSA4]